MARWFKSLYIFRLLSCLQLPLITFLLHQPARGQVLRVGAFYTNDFTYVKAHGWQLQVLISIILRYDIIFLQGIRDDNVVPGVINSALSVMDGDYVMANYPGFGFGNQRDLNVFIFRRGRVTLHDFHLHEEAVRWPSLIGFFTVEDDEQVKRCFTLIGKSVGDNTASDNLKGVFGVAETLLLHMGQYQAIAILGNLNQRVLKKSLVKRYAYVFGEMVTWNIAGINTMVLENGVWKDEIVTIGLMTDAVVPGTTAVFKFDYGWNDKVSAVSVSKHYPVEISLTIDTLPRYYQGMKLPFNEERHVLHEAARLPDPSALDSVNDEPDDVRPVTPNTAYGIVQRVPIQPHTNQPASSTFRERSSEHAVGTTMAHSTDLASDFQPSGRSFGAGQMPQSLARRAPAADVQFRYEQGCSYPMIPTASGTMLHPVPAMVYGHPSLPLHQTPITSHPDHPSSVALNLMHLSHRSSRERTRRPGDPLPRFPARGSLHLPFSPVHYPTPMLLSNDPTRPVSASSSRSDAPPYPSQPVSTSASHAAATSVRLPHHRETQQQAGERHQQEPAADNVPYQGHRFPSVPPTTRHQH